MADYRVTEYRVTNYRVTDYRVTNYRVTDYGSPRAILRLIALEGLVASLLGRIFADEIASIGPRMSPASSCVLRRPTSDLEDDFSTFAYDWNQILFSESLPDSTNSWNTSRGWQHYLMSGSSGHVVYVQYSILSHSVDLKLGLIHH